MGREGGFCRGVGGGSTGVMNFPDQLPRLLLMADPGLIPMAVPEASD
jgi:hypothetical protein